MSYTCKITCGSEVVDEQEFDSRKEADEWGREWLGDCAVGAEVLEDAGRDFIDPDEYDYEIE